MPLNKKLIFQILERSILPNHTRLFGKMDKQAIFLRCDSAQDKGVTCCVKKCIENLLAQRLPRIDLISFCEAELSQRSTQLLLEYCMLPIASDNNITYYEVVHLVLARIASSEHKQELIRILEEEILRMKDSCNWGRIAITVSVLCGFFDDIEISITEKQRMASIIIGAMDKSDNAEDHRRLAAQMLSDAGYQPEEYQAWLDAIE
jgi:hypothetical protein